MTSKCSESVLPSMHQRMINASGHNVNATCNSSYSAMLRPSNTLSGIHHQLRAPSASQSPEAWSTSQSSQSTSCSGSVSIAAAGQHTGSGHQKKVSTFSSGHLAASTTRTVSVTITNTSGSHSPSDATAPLLGMSDTREGTHISSAEIAGVAIGGVLLLALLAACAFYLGRRSKAVQIHFEPAALQREHQRAPSALGRLRSRLRTSVDSVIMLGTGPGGLYVRNPTPGPSNSGDENANELIADRKASYHAKVEEVRSLQGSRSHPALRGMFTAGEHFGRDDSVAGLYSVAQDWVDGAAVETKPEHDALHARQNSDGDRPFRHSAPILIVHRPEDV